MRLRYIIGLMFLIVFTGRVFAQNVSIISYGVEEGDVFVRWKTVDTNLSFSIYRSTVLVSNAVSFSNNLSLIKKLGVFGFDKLKYKDGYLYFYDTSPNIGTNYYIVFANKDGREIIEFEPEQNYSELFLVFIPLPKVSVNFDKDVNTAIITWERVNNVEGYLVYKLPLGFNGNLFSQTPLASLPSNQTILFDVMPKDNSFFYAIIPFTRGITNYYFSSKYNSVVLYGSGETNITKSQEPVLQYTQRDSKIDGYSVITTNFITNYITNFVVFTNTNVVYMTNRIVESRNVGSDSSFSMNVGRQDKSIKNNFQSMDNIQNNLFILSSEDVEGKFKEIVSKFFSKKKYSIARDMFRNLLNEVYDDNELKGRIMVYIARCEYALGNKDEAIKLLFRAKNFVPTEADFWLSRFLVNR